MQNIKIKSLGPIREADINFGDLTFFVGPQASGKSILLQLIKLVSDKNAIETRLENYGYVWGTNEDNSLERFFGEGMDRIWDEKSTEIKVDGSPFTRDMLLPQKPGRKNEKKETVFYVPAQRAICLESGWPRFFKDYEISAPYVLRDFSETLRQYLDAGFSNGRTPVFPQDPGIFNGQLTDSFNESIFHMGKVTVELEVKKRLMLKINDMNLPFIVWSAGQKEFMPLLLSFYWLCPPNKFRRNDLTTVIIEEPEMGLHPEAIKSVLLQIIDLLRIGYKVIVSSHSPVLLEFAWAFNFLKRADAGDGALLALFGLQEEDENKALVKDILNDKTIRTYFFENKNYKVRVKDISSLDPGNEDLAVADWGGLSSFASKAADIVSAVAAHIK